MKTLEHVWGDLNFGDILLVQEEDHEGNISEPKLITVVGIDVFDMAVAIDYVDYKSFNQYNNILVHRKKTTRKPKEMKTEIFAEWTEYMYILGYWKKMPNFRNLLKSYRKRK